ncbi:hypothetical protein H257_16392 [Aphanomyces astaci]|uniref:Uncharacterized protein n=1 Tax=Aphanomyces astaci TaxID=112090 RepID=W4FIS9_APHAT|nr:hypothetical protein H257_16392 [Aphanomyces astaci]ETV67417.1 hypothetical protein H257_16392 [Aphanomyces astaci]|eukprot:XP_009843108.1 hypothetical protein H257_16392 [Aphanomyces astaci]
MARRWSKNSAAQHHLKSLFDDHTITARTKAAEAYNLSPIFHEFNFAAFQKHYDTTFKMKFANFHRPVEFTNDSSDDVRVDTVSISKPECLVGEFYDYVKRESNAIVVLLVPSGAKGACEVDANDLSVLRVRWEWTANTCDPQLLFASEMATPNHRTYAKISGLQKAYGSVCGKNGSAPVTEGAIHLPFAVRVCNENA